MNRKLSEAIRSIVFAFDSNDDRRSVIRMLADKVAILEGQVEFVAKNFDCDEDAHKYKTHCRACSSEGALTKSMVSSEDLGLGVKQ